MGAKLRKRNCIGNPTEALSPVSSTSLSSMSYHPSQSSAEFYAEFKTALTKEDMHNLQILFSMIHVAKDSLHRCLLKYTTLPEFKHVFREELAKYYTDFNGKKNTDEIINESLRSHCFGVLSTHLDILTNINNPNGIENILYHTAVSHSCINDISSRFKMHDVLLLQCLKEEFGKYMHSNRQDSLKRYMELISGRIQAIGEEYSESSMASNFSDAMKRQKKFVRRTDRHNNIRQIYGNASTPSISEYSLIAPDQPVFPGTSSRKK